MKRKIIIFIILFVTGLLGILAYLSMQKHFASPQIMTLNSEDSFIVQSAVELGGDFELLDQKRQAFTQENLKGKISLMFFGFTFCPNYCPIELQNLTSLLKKLDQKGVADQVQIIFVTIDPERDTPDSLRDFVAPFDSRIIALAGEIDQINQIKEHYRVYAAKVVNDPDKPDIYFMDHSTFLYLHDQQGQVSSIIKYGAPPDMVADHIEKVLKAQK